MSERESLKPAIHLLSALLKHQVKKLVGEEALQVLSDELFDQAQTVLDTQLEGWFEEPHVKRQIEAAVVAAEDCFLRACQAEDVILAQWAASLPLGGLPTLHASVAKLPKQLDDRELESELGFIIGRDWPGLSAGQVEWAVRQYLFCLRNALLPLEKLHPYVIGRSALRTEWMVAQVQRDIQEMKAHQDLLVRASPKPTGSLPALPLPPAGKLPKLSVLPVGSRVPFYPFAPFLGRRRELAAIVRLLLAAHPGQEADTIPVIIPPVIMTGLGGIGKSQLALQFCYRYGRYFRGVYWINCGPDGQGQTIAEEIAACGREMGIGTGAKLSKRVALTLLAWRTSGPCLVVFDNLENPQALENWLPELAGMRLLVTARRSTWPARLGAHLLEVGPLNRAESRQMLRRLAGRLQDQPAMQVDAVAAKVGDHPLALRLAGAYLGSWDIPLDDYLARLEEQGPLQPLDEGGAPVSRTLQVQWEALTEPDARRVLSGAAALGNLLHINRRLLAGVLGLPDEGPPGYPSRLAQALKPLVDLSLLASKTSIEIRLHPLVQAFAALQEPPGGRTAFQRDLLANLIKSLQDPEHGGVLSLAAGEGLVELSRDRGGILPAARLDILKALLNLMQFGTTPVTVRRHAALLLGRLEWRSDLPGLHPVETLRYLELAGRYVYTRGERAFLIDRVITPCLDAETDLLDDHLRAQLLFFRAAMWAQLYQFDRAREDYTEANRILEALIASPECLPVDYQTWARVRLGFGRLAVEQAGQPVTNDPAVQDPRDDRSLRGKPALELAMRYFHEALEAARRYGDDQILETNIQSELSLTAALLGEREQALQAYQMALAVLSREEIRLRGADPEAWVYCRARVLETAGMVHWQLAENPDTCAGDPLAEYRLAYDLASEEIQLLEAESVQISDVLAVAHFNAGDFLQASAEYEPWEREEHIKAARRHWQAALDLSLKLGVEDVIEQADERLRETAPAAGLREK